MTCPADYNIIAEEFDKKILTHALYIYTSTKMNYTELKSIEGSAGSVKNQNEILIKNKGKIRIKEK